MDRSKMGAAPYGAQAKGADAHARRLRDIRRVHSWARRYQSIVDPAITRNDSWLRKLEQFLN